jgi:hypothetical protein
VKPYETVAAKPKKQKPRNTAVKSKNTIFDMSFVLAISLAVSRGYVSSALGLAYRKLVLFDSLSRLHRLRARKVDAYCLSFKKNGAVAAKPEKQPPRNKAVESKNAIFVLTISLAVSTWSFHSEINFPKMSTAGFA